MLFLITSFCVVFVVVCLHFEQICFEASYLSVYIARIHIHSPTAPKHERDTLQQEILLDGYLHHGLISIPPFAYLLSTCYLPIFYWYLPRRRDSSDQFTNNLYGFCTTLFFAAVYYPYTLFLPVVGCDIFLLALY